ncbi:MAG: PilN domain-containing protein, partial [Sandaracinaceae bacterium]
ATDSLAVLAALTAHVPDTAYLTAIRLDGAAVRIEGEARDAAGLLANLAGAAPFRDVRFASPVTGDGETGTERVQIALTLAGGDTP